MEYRRAADTKERGNFDEYLIGYYSVIEIGDPGSPHPEERTSNAISAGLRYHCLQTVTIIGALLRIGGLPIERPHSLTCPQQMSCRNTKKPTKAKWLLGEDCAENVDVEWKDRVL